jgi:archaellum component FlaF (FlaF/FlaG flagellin family)
MHDLKNLNFLLPKTQNVLKKLIKDCPFLKKYVLVGGSALTLHVKHRKSEDLDFFTYEDSFDKKEILAYIGTFEKVAIINQTNEQMDILLDGVKVTFFNAKWSFLTPSTTQTFNLATLEAIAAMKVNVLFLRGKYRDYYDMYFLEKVMGLRKIFHHAQNVVEGINMKLFIVSLLYIDDIEDDAIEYLEPEEIISKEEIRDYFQKQIDKLK